ncbi:glycosyl transferase family protein [Sphingomonas sp. ID0503]|uniref:glycosyl transferase family protein n=1 Tax=Sphingomonas sp. ID0503 TaxID=3399691 RepID=UPI003AFA0827
MGGTAVALVEAAAHELTLFAAIGLLLGGIDDVLVDCIWIGRTLWRRSFVYTRHDRACAVTLVPPDRPGRIAVFVAAWHEAEVIGAMLHNAVARFDHPDYRIYVGCYPNDPATIAAVQAVGDPRIRIALNPENGPTTKADNLNAVWTQMLADERGDGVPVKAVVLHDAEDVVHSAELRIVDSLIERVALVQLPVLPLLDPSSRWVAGSYADEFAESHGKGLIVREALGASVPLAGTGCGIARAVLDRIEAESGGKPFDPGSLTEDYELGLRIRAAGGRGIFVRLPTTSEGSVVAVRAYFPNTFATAVRQKARWKVGIALAGWDRLGWEGGPVEYWMRFRDRRVLISAVILAAAYTAIVLQAALTGWRLVWGMALPAVPPLIGTLMWINTGILLWRFGMRMAFVGDAYGWREGLRSLPRMVIANAITIAASLRAVQRYAEMRRRGRVEWDKTVHAFPDILPAG